MQPGAVSFQAAGSGTYVARRGGSSGTVAPLISYNVKDYGATGDGTTDDSAAIQAAVTAAIASGGIVVVPQGTYNILTALDFSALAGTAKRVSFVGAGGGAGQPTQAYIPAFGGTTIFLNGTGGSCIKATGTATASPIAGLRLAGFTIKDTATKTTLTYSILLDLVTEQVSLEDIYVFSNGQGGNGIAFLNLPLGQSTFDRVIVEGFTGSGSDGVGFRISSENTTNEPAHTQGGNSSFRSCAARDCRVGWYLNSSLINGLTFISCKAVNVAATNQAGSIGFYINGLAQSVFLACHSERFNTGFYVNSGSFNTIISPLASTTGTMDASSAGVRITGTSWGNTVVNARCSGFYYGVSFEGNAQSNEASGDDIAGARVVTAFFRDVSTLGTNVTRKIEDASTTPVISFPGHSVLVDGVEAIGPELAKLTSGEATIPRLVANLGNAATMTSQVFRLTYFTARKTETITQLRLSSGTTAAGATPSLVRAGIWLIDSVASRSVSDGVSNGTTTITSATAAFTSADVYRTITGTDIPAGTYIASVTNSTTAVLSQAASGSHTGDSWTIGGVGNGASVAAIANDTSIFAATNTEYLRSLTSNFPKVKGQRYALGILVVTAATAPLLGGAQILGAGGAAGAFAASRGPRLSGALTAQADLPNTFTDASLTATGNMVYAELVP